MADKKLDVKNSVRLATAVNPILNLSDAPLVIDSKTIEQGDRILVKDGASKDGVEPVSDKRNGIYIVQKIKNGRASLVRSRDANNNVKVTSGMFVFVSEGATNKDTGWVLITDDPISLDETELTFINFSSSGEVSADVQKLIDQNSSNIALNSFRIQATSTLTLSTMVDGFVDEYGDESGIDNTASIDEIYDATNRLYKTEDNQYKLLLKLNGNDGQTTTVDDSADANIITFVGNAKLKANYAKFGQALELNGTNQYLSIADSPDFDLFANTTDDYTVDLWVRHDQLNSPTQHAYLVQNNGTLAWEFFLNTSTDKIIFNINDGVGSNNTNSVTTATINDTNWHHVALVKVGGSPNYKIGVYLDGQQISYLDISRTVSVPASLWIGRAFSSIGMDGNLDEIRIQKSNAFSATPNVGQTDTITVPTAPHTADANTKLLMHFDVETGDLTDSSTSAHSVTSVNGAGVSGRFGSARLTLDGAGDKLETNDSDGWDIVGDLVSDYTIDLWVKHTNFNGDSEVYFNQFESSLNHQFFYMTSAGGGSLYYYHQVNGVPYATPVISTPSLIDKKWHHVALVKKADKIGLYLDGDQVNYLQITNPKTYNANLNIGANWIGTSAVQGDIDEYRIQKSNVFNADPNPGLSDTITVPTTESTTLGITNTTLVSEPQTAQAQPDNAKVMVFLEAIDPVVLGTDFKAYASRDGGTTFTEVTLVMEAEYESNKMLLAGTEDISSQPAGTSMVYKLETLNNKNLKIHGTGMFWS